MSTSSIKKSAKNLYLMMNTFRNNSNSSGFCIIFSKSDDFEFVLIIDEKEKQKLNELVNKSIFVEKTYSLNGKDYLCEPGKINQKMKKFVKEDYELLFKSSSAREYFVGQIMNMPKWKDEIRLSDGVFNNLKQIMMQFLDSILYLP